MRRTARACLLVCVVALAAAVPAAGTVEPPVGDGTGGVRMKHLGRFDEPVYATTAPGRAGSDLVFVVERGGIVRDQSLESLYGRYLYGDLCLGELRSFTPRPGRPAGDDVALGPLVERLSSFGEGADGTVYAVSLSGPVYRLAPAD